MFSKSIVMLSLLTATFALDNCKIQKSYTYLDRTRTWVIEDYKYDDITDPKEYCMKYWENHNDICPEGWKVIHTDPLMYDIKDDIKVSEYKLIYSPVTCIKKQICQSP